MKKKKLRTRAKKVKIDDEYSSVKFKKEKKKRNVYLAIKKNMKEEEKPMWVWL